MGLKNILLILNSLTWSEVILTSFANILTIAQFSKIFSYIIPIHLQEWYNQKNISRFNSRAQEMNGYKCIEAAFVPPSCYSELPLQSTLSVMLQLPIVLPALSKLPHRFLKQPIPKLLQTGCFVIVLLLLSIYYNSPTHLHSNCCYSLSQLTSGVRWGATWTSYHLITGPRYTDKYSLSYLNLRSV